MVSRATLEKRAARHCSIAEAIQWCKDNKKGAWEAVKESEKFAALGVQVINRAVKNGAVIRKNCLLSEHEEKELVKWLRSFKKGKKWRE